MRPERTRARAHLRAVAGLSCGLLCLAAAPLSGADGPPMEILGASFVIEDAAGDCGEQCIDLGAKGDPLVAQLGLGNLRGFQAIGDFILFFDADATIRNTSSSRLEARLSLFQTFDSRIGNSDDRFVAGNQVVTFDGGEARRVITELQARNEPGEFMLYFQAEVVSSPGKAASPKATSDIAGISIAAADLVVENPQADPSQVSPGGTTTVSATIRNQGDVVTLATTARFYVSNDPTITTSDTELATVAVPALAAGPINLPSTADVDADLTLELAPGGYFVGVCVDFSVKEGPGQRNNNCSTGVPVDVVETGSPDLVVANPALDAASSVEGEANGLTVLVRNQGTAGAAATTLRFYRSDNETISAADTEIGTTAQGALAAGGETEQSLAFDAPGPGTWFYGACVDDVPGESSEANNCTSGVPLEVTPEGGGGDAAIDQFFDLLCAAFGIACDGGDDVDPPASPVTIRVGPQICDAEVPAQAFGLEWREQWLVNTRTDGELSVLCPIPKSLASDRLDVAVEFITTDGKAREVQCDFTEYRPDAGLLQRITRFGDVTAAEPTTIALTDFAFGAIESQLSLRCGLPPQIAITRLSFTFDAL